jgi:hypothetical protein
MLDYEQKYYDQGMILVAGVDEAGRGPLAGPVCVASVIMPQSPILEEINDSKKLSEKKREKLFEQIKELAISYHIELIDNKTIDEINILNATKLGMKRCIESLEVVPEIAIIDAVKIDTEIPTDSIIKGDAISYNRTFVAERDMVVAVVSCGYADGLHRSLSNRGYFLIGGKRAPILGNVCMDLSIVDVTDIDGVKPFDEAIIFGGENDFLSADELASIANTIPYELLTSVSKRVPRTYSGAFA